MTLWGLHAKNTVPDDLPHHWHANGVEAVIAEPMYGVEGPCEFDPDGTGMSAVTFRSLHLRLDRDESNPSCAVETPYGTLTVATDKDWSRHGKPCPVTEIRLTFPDPVPFESEGRQRLAALSFLCEALTGRAHNFNGTEFEIPLADYAYHLHDFHKAGAPVFPRYEGSDPYPHVGPGEFLDIGTLWLDLFLAENSAYPEIFSHLAESLARHVQYDRLRVFQSVNVFDLFPSKGLSDSLGKRIKLVTKKIDELGLHSDLPFTAANLRKFRQWGVAMRDRVVHGSMDTRGKSKPRPAYCDDPQSWMYVCDTLEFILALSTLIECGLDFHQWHARSQPQKMNKFRDVTSPCQFGKMISHIETLASPAGKIESWE